MKRLSVFSLFLLVLLWGTVRAVDPDGDINIDGDVDIVDVLWGYQALTGMRVLDPDQEGHGDVAPLVSGVPVPNDVFDLGDVLVIQRKALGLIDFSYCGDGVLQEVEQCDDGNTSAGDGCDETCQLELPLVPLNQFNIGDSIGEGEAAKDDIFNPHHETVWSTGYDATDSVNSINERFESIEQNGYYENNLTRDSIFNHAVSGAEMVDFSTQAQAVIASTAQTPSGEAGMVTVFLGNNDVCADSNAEMTEPALFESQYRAGLDLLASDPATQNAYVHVSGIPAIYWLWNAKWQSGSCRFIWLFAPCQNLLGGAQDDCESDASREDPDTIYQGDGTNCQRRKEFHALIRDTYNPILRDVLAEYRDAGDLPNASYIDIFDVRFESVHVNSGDCFHPSEAGHSLLSEVHWCRSQWSSGDPQCIN